MHEDFGVIEVLFLYYVFQIWITDFLQEKRKMTALLSTFIFVTIFPSPHGKLFFLHCQGCNNYFHSVTIISIVV